MARGDHFPSERLWFRDPRTGAMVYRLTGYYVHSTKFSYTTQSWTPDGEWIVFFSEIGWGRGAPISVFKVSSDGRVIVQLSDTESHVPYAAIDGVRNRVLMIARDEVRGVDLATCDEEVLWKFDGASGWGGMTIDVSGRYGLTTFTQKGRCRLVRLDLETGDALELFSDPNPFGRAQYCRTPAVAADGTERRTIRFSSSLLKARPDIEYHQCLWVMDEGEEVPRVPHVQGPDQEITHDSWLGASREILFIQCDEPHPAESYPSTIRAVDVDTGVVRVIGERGSYWHCSANPEGTLIVSDTNWPQRGLILLDAETGQERTLCWPGESGGAPGWSHPHASFSPDGTRVLYNSDANGICQIYQALVEE